MSPDGRCGLTTVHRSGTGVSSIDIQLWGFQSNGAPCNPYYDELAHELGHALGLGDAPTGSACEGHIMGTRQRGTTRAVDANDCTRADSSWRVPGETSGGSGEDGSTPRPCV
jgi:hypothetical protein